MKVFPLSTPFHSDEISGKYRSSEYSFYGVFCQGSIKADINAPYSNYYNKKLIYQGKEVVRYTEKNKDYPLAFLTDESGEKIKIFGVEESYIFTGNIVGSSFIHSSEKSDNYICVYDKSDDEFTEKDIGLEYISYLPVLNDFPHFYFLSKRPFSISKIDQEFDVKWNVTRLNSHKSGHTNTRLFSYEDSIISNIGCTDEETQNDGEVISLYKDSGETKWSKHFDHEIHSCNVVEDRVYLTGHNLWYVLNAQNGEILLKGDAELGEHIEGTGNSLWSDGDFLYFSSSHGNVIRVYSESNGEFWGDISVPEGYKVDWEPPVSKDGYHYFKLIGSNWAEQGTVHGVLVVTAQEIKAGAPFNIEIETYDKVNKYLEESKGESLILEFDENELGNILRFGQIEANKYVVNNTYNLCASMAPDYGEHINNNFNGEVIIKIKKESLDQKLEDRLDLMCEFINDHNKDCIAPFKKQKVKAIWEWI